MLQQLAVGAANLIKLEEPTLDDDFDLPDGNGLSIVRKAAARHSVVILMSGRLAESIHDDAIAAGAVVVLQKPFDVASLLELLPSVAGAGRQVLKTPLPE